MFGSFRLDGAHRLDAGSQPRSDLALQEAEPSASGGQGRLLGMSSLHGRQQRPVDLPRYISGYLGLRLRPSKDVPPERQYSIHHPVQYRPTEVAQLDDRIGEAHVKSDGGLDSLSLLFPAIYNLGPPVRPSGIGFLGSTEHVRLTEGGVWIKLLFKGSNATLGGITLKNNESLCENKFSEGVFRSVGVRLARFVPRLLCFTEKPWPND